MSRKTPINAVGGVYNSVAPAFTDGQFVAFQFDASGNLLTSGGGGGGNNSVSLVGNPVPLYATAIGWDDGSGNLQFVSAANPLPITGSISASNPSVGTIGSTAPTSATFLGVVNGSGNLEGVGAANPVRVDPTGTTAQPVTGTFWQATQPVSGTFWQTTQPVSFTAQSATAGSTPAAAVLIAGNDAGTMYALTCTNSGQLEVIASQNSGTSLHVVTDGSSVTNATIVGNSDVLPSTVNITARDIATTSTTYANGQIFITGAPTASSFAEFVFSTLVPGTVEVFVTGTWTGTLQVELSPDNGTTYIAQPLQQLGLSTLSATFTNNFCGQINASGYTRIRVRATAAWTGTATVKVVESQNPSIVALSPIPAFAVTQSTSPWIVAGGGVAGTPGTAVLTVQGISGGTTIPVTATIAASQTIAVTQGTAASLNATVSIAAAQTLATVTTVAAVTAITNALPAGTNLLGQVSASDETSTVYNGTTALTPGFAVIAVSSSGPGTVVAAVSSKKIRVLSMNLMANGTVNVKWQSHATPTDLTGLAYLVANTGYILPYNPTGWFQTVAGEALDINLSGSIAVGGHLSYVAV